MKVIILCLLFYSVIPKLETTEIIDNFDSYQNYSHAISNWRSLTFGFQIENNKLIHKEKEFSILIWRKSEYAYDTYFEIEIEVDESYKTADWEFIGAALYKKESEYYAVQLVESKATGKRYPELKIVSDLELNDIGKSISVTGYDYVWNFNEKYKLTIEIKEGKDIYQDEEYISIIKAHIYDKENQLVYEHIFGILNKNALLFGKAAITSCDMRNNILKAYSNYSKISDYKPNIIFPEYDYKNYCSKTLKEYKLPIGKKTGYFHSEFFPDDEKWWIIDPLGNPIFMKGISHINYMGVYNNGKQSFPYNENVKKKFNNNETLWAIEQKKILDENGFNFLSIDSSKSLRHLGIPHSIEHFSEEFSKKYDYIIPNNMKGFPNVFNPIFDEYLVYVLEKDSEEYLNDPWVVGHFFDNELFWWGSNTFTDPDDYGLFSDVIILDSDNLAKIELVNLIYDKLTQEYSSLEEGMITVFGIQNIKTKNDLLENKNKIKPETDKAKEIAINFIRTIAETYYKKVSSTIHKIDPNHMYLCDRFPGKIPFFADIVEKYCDIITINYYPSFNPYSGIDPNMNQYLSELNQKVKNKPLYITEWSVMALDVGLPSLTGAGLRVISQEQRAHSIQLLQLFFSSQKFIVGSDYFMYIDDPYEANENCNYGFKNEQDEVYDLVSNYFIKANEQVCARHINEEYQDLHQFNNAEWINESNLKKIDIENFQGSRNIKLIISENNLLQIKYKDTLLGNIKLLFQIEFQTKTFWNELTSYKIVAIYENDYLYNLELSGACDFAKINFIINIPKAFTEGENESWFLAKVKSFELFNQMSDYIIINLISILYNSNIGEDGKSNDIFGNESPIPSYYQSNNFIYDKNINLGLSLVPFGKNLIFQKNVQDITMEVVLNLENKIKVEPGQIINFEDFIKIEKMFFVAIDDILSENPFAAYNTTLYNFEKEIIQYTTPKNFEYEDNNEINNYLYMISLDKIFLFAILSFLFL